MDQPTKPPTAEELQQEADFGKDVREFLGNAMWEHAYRATKSQYVQALLESSPGPEGAANREAIHAELCALDRMFGNLRDWAARGVDAERALMEMNERLAMPKDIPVPVDDDGKPILGPDGQPMRVN